MAKLRVVVPMLQPTCGLTQRRLNGAPTSYITCNARPYDEYLRSPTKKKQLGNTCVLLSAQVQETAPLVVLKRHETLIEPMLSRSPRCRPIIKSTLDSFNVSCLLGYSAV